MRIYIDLKDRILPGPKPGDFLISLGVRKKSAYLVLESYQVKRRDPQAVPRFQMKVEWVDPCEVPDLISKRAKVFRFKWYSRDKKKLTFEQNLSQEIQRLQ